MEEVVKKAKKGDKEAFTKLILTVENELYHVAKARLKNENDVYDAIQETCIIAYKNIKKLREVKYFKTWIIKILINVCNLIYKKNMRLHIVSFEEVGEIKGINSFSIEETDATLDLNYIYDKLKEEERTIIILYYIDSFTDKEIGRILKLKENTAKTKRIRTMKKIKEIIEKERKDHE